MIAWLIRRREQKNYQMDRFAVQALEVHAVGISSDRRDDSVHRRVFGVRYCNSPPESRRSKLFASHYRGDDVVLVIVGDLARGDEPLDKRTDRFCLILCPETEHERLTRNKVERANELVNVLANDNGRIYNAPVR